MYFISRSNINIIVLIPFFFFACSQNNNAELKTVSTSDFNGQPDYSIPALAFTYCGVFYKITSSKLCRQQNKIHVSVTTEVRLLKDKSWLKLDQIKNKADLDELLSHEQGHYEIFEIYNLNFKNAIENDCFDKTKYRSEIDSIYSSMFRHFDTLQRQYDFESEGMRNKTKQIEWKLRIRKMYLDAQKRNF